MKFYRRLLKTVLLAVLLSLPTVISAQTNASQQEESAIQDSLLAQMDSVSISLLTCSPGQQIWSLYGHTAIRYEDKLHHTDLAINYGTFSFSQKNFIIKFVFGRTDYEMGIEPMSMFLMEYASLGRGVLQQTLNLSREEKATITQALAQNYQPSQRVYRYNYFYDNCTTRARDILANHLNGKIEYTVNPSVTSSYREMIHQWNGGHRWMRFGKDLLLGVKADRKTDFAQQQFLPDTLRKDFDKAAVVEPTGRKHPLVTETKVILQPNSANVKVSKNIWDTLTPRIVFVIVLVITIIIGAIECKRKKSFWLYDVVLLTLDGLAGLVLLAMVFSDHPTVRLNFQILLLNPLSLLFAYSVGNSIIKGRFNYFWKVLLVCIILFLLGGLLQDYAEGMYLLACTLLVRIIINRHLYAVSSKRK